MTDDLPDGWVSGSWTSVDPFQPANLDGAEYARRRDPQYNYYYRSFPLPSFHRENAGYPGRFVYQVFECPDDDSVELREDLEWTELTLAEQGTRKQVRILVGREMGRVLELKFQGVPASGDLKHLFTLRGEDGARFVDLVKSLEFLPVDGTEEGHRISGELVRQVLTDPHSIQTAYEQEPERFAALISRDVTASDVIAVARHREQLNLFRRLLEDADFFDRYQETVGARGPEDVWQKYLEANPWVLGVGLSGQLLTSWDPDKLEQVVVGASAIQAGKRTDAMMRTVGAISSMVFAEIKHHRTSLLAQVQTPYRPATWAPSRELAGGVIQIQQTVYHAREHFTERVQMRDEDGRETGQVTFLIRPKSYLIAGHLSEIAPEGNVDPDKFRSFELFRRSLYEPEVITFDELLARAEWHLAEAERESEERG